MNSRFLQVLRAGVAADAPAQKRLRDTPPNRPDDSDSDYTDTETRDGLSAGSVELLKAIVVMKAVVKPWTHSSSSDPMHNQQISSLVLRNLRWISAADELMSMRGPVDLELAPGSLQFVVERLADAVGLNKKTFALHFTAVCTALFRAPELAARIHPTLLDYLRTAPLFDPAVVCFVYNSVTVETGLDSFVDVELLENVGLSPRDIFLHWNHLKRLVEVLVDPSTQFLDTSSTILNVQGLVEELLLKADARPSVLVASAAQEMGLEF